MDSTRDTFYERQLYQEVFPNSKEAGIKGRENENIFSYYLKNK